MARIGDFMNYKHYRRTLSDSYNDHIKKNDDIQSLEKTSKNVKEQKKKLFGVSGNPATKSSKGQAQMEALKDFAQRRYGVDIVPSKGKFDPKKGEYRKKNAKIGTDKPDWRGESGYEISSQSNPGAQSHELGHLEQMPVGRKAHEHQTIMDQEVGEAVKYGGGPTASFRHPSEVQARAAENPLRRRAGLPPHTPTADVSEGDPMRVVLGTQNEPAAVRYVDKKGKLVDQLKSGKLLSPENRQRMQDIDEGILRYDHKQGWAPSNDNNALINLRGQGRQEEAAQRLKQKYSNPNPQQDAIDLSSLSEDDHKAVQEFLAQRRGKLAASEDYDDLQKGIKLTHYSKQQGLSHLDPEYMGTGAPSEENKQGIPSVKQTSYYREGVEPESVVASGAKSRYTVEHPDESALYDIYEDPQGLVAESFKQQGRLDRDHMAQTLRDAGYHGFYTTHPHYAKQGVVNLFHKMPIAGEEKLDKAFSSKTQRRFAYANPEKFGGQKGIKEWESETPKNIPEKVEDDLKKGLRDKLKAIFSPKPQSQGNPSDPWLGINDQKPVYRRRYAHFQGTHGKPNLPKSEDLQKMSRGRLEFPKLGVGSRKDQEVQSIESPRQLDIFARKNALKFKGGVRDLFNNKVTQAARPITPNEEAIAENIFANKYGTSAPKGVFRSHGIVVGNDKARKAAVTDEFANPSSKRREHEAIHVLVNDIGAKHGNAAQQNALKSINDLIHPSVQQVLSEHMEASGYKSHVFDKEMVPHLYEMLHDKNTREVVRSTSPAFKADEQNIMSHAKRSWDAIRSFAKKVQPGDLK